MIRLSKSCTGPKELEAVTRVMQRSFFGMGEEVFAFEKELADFLHVPEVACVNTGTSALQLALEAAGIGHGDEVLVPTLTYVATFQAVSATGATPIACDVSEESLTLHLQEAARKLTPRTKAIIFVHYASRSGNLEKIYQFAQEHQLRIIEDAAHAFGCKHQGKLIGSFGDIICFSFDGIKNITSGEGGAIVSRDPKILQYTKEARLLGIQPKKNDFDVRTQGWRYHMSDLFAAIGRVQLKRLTTELGPRRISLAKRYQERFAHIPAITLIPFSEETIPHIYPIRVTSHQRETLRENLLTKGISTGLHYKPNHLLSYYQNNETLPVAEKLYRELLTLPLHPDITDEEQNAIIDAVQNTCQNFR